MRKTERKTTSSRSSDLEELSLPTSNQGQGQEELARHEIRDATAMGGMSQLELQAKLATDVFLTDEDRNTYQEASAAFRQSPAPAVAPQLSQESEQQFAKLKSPAQGLQFENIDLAKVQAPLPAKGPLGGPDALGGENSLAPQGLMKPSGLLMSYGMLGFVRGLMGIRSSMPQEKSPFQPQQQSAPTQSASKSQPTAGAAPSKTEASQMAGPQAGPKSSFGVATNDEARMHFQPVSSAYQSQIPSPWQKRGKSPFEEVLGRLLKLIASLFGLGNSRGGYRGGRPELGK